MIRTVVCEKEGCAGNSFYIKNVDDTLCVGCVKCDRAKEFELGRQQYIMLSNCCNCNNDTFKVFKDTDSNRIYVKCIKCGNPPEQVYVDVDGNQVSYETKILNDMREIVYRTDQTLQSLEKKIEALENGQELLEQSLAYVTKFLSQ